MKQSFTVTGMTCSACSAHVEKAVSHLEGVRSVAVSLMTNSMTVEYDEQNKPVRIHTIVISTQHDEFVQPADDSRAAQDAADREMLDRIYADVRDILIPRVLAKLPDRLFAALPWLLGGIFRAVCELPEALGRALGDEIEDKVMETLGVVPHHREGVTSNWVLVDYTGVVVNIFQQEAREMYALERLWGDGTRIDISNLTVKEDETK